MVAVHAGSSQSSIEIILANVNDIIVRAKGMKRVQFIAGERRVNRKRSYITDEYKTASDALRRVGRMNLYQMKCKELHPTNDVDTYYAAANAILAVIVDESIPRHTQAALLRPWRELVEAHTH